MAKIFYSVQDGHSRRKDIRLSSVSNTLVQITEQEEIDEESSSSSFAEYFLPNVDGANDDSSEEEPSGCGASKRTKKDRKYKPLLFRTTKSIVYKVQQDAGTTLKLLSPSSSPPGFLSASSSSTVLMPQVNYSIADETQSENRNVYNKSASTANLIIDPIAMSNNC